ncbi:hypothetical protein Tco_0815847 [Tanacetum coccineum]
MPAVPPSSVYEVGGPSTAATEGQSFPLRAPELPVPPSVIEDLNWCPGEARSADYDLERRGDCRTNSAGAGSSAAERYTDSAAADYSFRDEQPGEHTNVV